MTLVEHYVTKEKVVKCVTREIVLDLQPQKIEKVFHVPRVDWYLKISYDGVEWWYKDKEKEEKKIVQSSSIINTTHLGHRLGKVDMNRGYMKDDIRYVMVLLSRVMGLPVVGHLQTWMVNLIETIKIENMPID